MTEMVAADQGLMEESEKSKDGNAPEDEGNATDPGFDSQNGNSPNPSATSMAAGECFKVESEEVTLALPKSKAKEMVNNFASEEILSSDPEFASKLNGVEPASGIEEAFDECEITMEDEFIVSIPKSSVQSVVEDL